VFLDVTGSAEESHVERSSVVVVVSVSAWLAASFAWLGFDVPMGVDSCQDFCAKIGVVGVSLSALSLDPLGVSFVERAVESFDRISARLSKVAASL
jgi:hypothetical protein